MATLVTKEKVFVHKWGELRVTWSTSTILRPIGGREALGPITISGYNRLRKPQRESLQLPEQPAERDVLTHMTTLAAHDIRKTESPVPQTETTIRRRKWHWISHTLRKPPTSITRTALDCWNPQGKHHRGRPCLAWRRGVRKDLERANRKDLERANVTWQETKKIAKNKKCPVLPSG
ncbi:hypothetical protein Bbelb_315950 [Branchiostoma belcheri]|nr:hypothetical protein Bbelb_315950 [Branchiostoma belcheri]